MRAKELISEQIPVLDASDLCGHALALMQRSKLCDLPVVRDGRYAGLVSEPAIMQTATSGTPVSEVISCAPMLFANQLWMEAMPIISRFDIGLIPVVTNEKTYIGSILIGTFAKTFAEMMGLSENTLIIIEINNQDYIPSEIAKLVEANNAKIVTLFTQSLKQTNKLWVYLTLYLEDASPVIHCLERLEYKIIHSSARQNIVDDALKNRLDEFLHYLKI